MRTTLRLDDDLAKILKEETERSGRSFKQTVNDILRAGLASQREPKAGKPYRLRPTSFGGPVAGVDLDHALRIADALEDEAIVRKVE